MNLDLRARILIVLGAIGVALFLLLPSWRYYRLSEDDLAGMDPNKVEEMKTDALRLGLDLQGGMHMVLELDDSDLQDPDLEAGDLMERALEIIRNRIDQFGVSEPVVQRAGEKRIIVELAGIDDIGRAKDIIAQAAVLEFKMVHTGSELRSLLVKADEELARRAGVTAPDAPTPEGEFDADTTASLEDTTAAASDTPEFSLGDRLPASNQSPDSTAVVAANMAGWLAEDVRNTGGRPLSSAITLTQQGSSVHPNQANIVAHVNEADFERVNAYLTLLTDSTRVISEADEFAWSSDVISDGAGNRIRRLWFMTKRPELTGEHLENAQPQPDSGSNIPGNFLVQFDMSRQGRRLFSRTTGENVGRLMAIVLDGRVKSAPEIQQKIRGGTATITGQFTVEEATDLSIVLRAGALPVPIIIEEQRAVGPSLGHDSIDLGRKAIAIGFVAVLIFMLIYYRAAGVIAVAALLLNLVLMLAMLVFFDAVITLPGLAGFVLTVGMAVDANVLIFERIREELRQGQTFRNAISRGYDRAFRTILDANLTTLFAAFALIWFGTGPIKGFAITLSVGIAASMFTALFVSRLIFDLVTRSGGVRQLPV